MNIEPVSPYQEQTANKTLFDFHPCLQKPPTILPDAPYLCSSPQKWFAMTRLSPLFLIPLLFLSFTQIGSAQDQKEAFFSERIDHRWATKNKLKTPESVYFDQKRGVLYVSNINGEADAKAGNGFISKLDMDGNIVKLKWVKGLHAPKGMDVHNGKLYVGDVGAIVEIDIEKGEIAKRHNIPESEFLNDIAIDEKGRVYCSDMYANKIYRLKGKKPKVWLEHKALERPNGVMIEGHHLLVGNSDQILKVNLKNKDATIYVEDTGPIDGLQVAQGGYLITDWKGRTYLVGPDREKELLINTIPENQNAADLEYIPEIQMMYIPTFKDNRVVAYKLIK